MDLSKDKPILVTPELAQKFLDTQKKQRRLNWRHVQSLAGEMSRDEWRKDAPPLVFASAGPMIDGQHRCAAVIMSGVSVWMRILKNAPKGYQDHIDGGLVRPLRTKLQMERPQLGNITTRVGSLHVCAYLLTGFPNSIKSITEYDRWYAIFGTGIDWAVDAIGGLKITRTSTVIGSIAFAYRYDPDSVEQFGLLLASGEGLHAGDPAHTFRKTLADRAPTGGTQRAEASRKALNALKNHVMGDKMLKTSVSNYGLDFFRKSYDDDEAAQEMAASWQPMDHNGPGGEED